MEYSSRPQRSGLETLSTPRGVDLLRQDVDNLSVSHVTAALIGGLIGGVIGGVLGVVGTLVSSYYGPRRLEQWREERDAGPRKDLLMRMLTDPKHKIRSLERLTLVTGMSDDDCRRLLITMGARGVVMSGEREGWALIERYGFEQDTEVTAEPGA